MSMWTRFEASMERVFELGLSAVDRSVMVIGPVLLVGGWSLVLFVAYVFFSTPFFSPGTDPWWMVLGGNAVGAWLLFNILFNWFLGFKTDPGRVPTTTTTTAQQSEQDMDGVCRKCDASKPVKAHHCHSCRRCVLGFDHHCPWFHACIGFFNYRYFILTLVYLSLGCIFVFTLAWGKLGVRSRKKELHHVFFVTALTFCVSFAVEALLVWHVYLVLSGQSTIDFYQRRMERDDTSAARASLVRRRRNKVSAVYWLCVLRWRSKQPQLPRNDYDLGPGKNWERVFGTPSVWLSLLPSTRLPVGDGVHWQTCKSLLLQAADRGGDLV